MAPNTAVWMRRGQGGAASGVLPGQSGVLLPKEAFSTVTEDAGLW